MKHIYIIITLLLLLPTLVFTQDGYTYQGLSYSMAIPTTGTEDYIPAGSYRGMNYDGFHQFKSHFALGWLLGWNVFHQELKNETYIKDNFTVTGNQFRYQNEFPMLVKGLYLPGEPDGIKPYLGAGLGVIYNIRRTDIGLYSLKTDSWHFAIAPELGLLIPIRISMMTASVRYNYGVKASELGQQSYLSFNFGFLFTP